MINSIQTLGIENSSGTLVASGGSTYEINIEMNNSTWDLGDTIVVNESIKALSFGDSIRDLHDIELSILISDGNDFSHTAVSAGLGSVESIGLSFDIMWLITVDDGFPDSFSIYLGSEFREDKSGTFDPRTNDGWNWVTDISVNNQTGETLPASNNPIEQNEGPYIQPAYDVVYEVGTLNHILRWIPQGDYPSIYEIFRNGNLIEQDTWNDEVAIEISVDNLTAGEYEYEINVEDIYGLSSSSTASVIVVTDLESYMNALTAESIESNTSSNDYNPPKFSTIITWVAIIAFILFIFIRYPKYSILGIFILLGIIDDATDD